MTKYFHLANHKNFKGWVLWMIATILTLVDMLITLITLGLVISDFANHFLFSELVTDDDRTEDETWR